MWQQWVNAVLGLWVIVVPFTGMTGSTLMWTLVVTGIAVAVLADQRLASVRVTVHKPSAPIDAEFSDVSVTIERAAIDFPRSTP